MLACTAGRALKHSGPFSKHADGTMQVPLCSMPSATAPQTRTVLGRACALLPLAGGGVKGGASYRERPGGVKNDVEGGIVGLGAGWRRRQGGRCLCSMAANVEKGAVGRAANQYRHGTAHASHRMQAQKCTPSLSAGHLGLGAVSARGLAARCG